MESELCVPTDSCGKAAPVLDAHVPDVSAPAFGLSAPIQRFPAAHNVPVEYPLPTDKPPEVGHLESTFHQGLRDEPGGSSGDALGRGSNVIFSNLLYPCLATGTAATLNVLF
ncbi:hypothetical protein FKM82_019414 [Ascaphus truei]